MDEGASVVGPKLFEMGVRVSLCRDEGRDHDLNLEVCEGLEDSRSGGRSVVGVHSDSL